jgi:hypothetical protein
MHALALYTHLLLTISLPHQSPFAKRTNDPLGAAALLLRGYISHCPLAVTETMHLRTLVAARLAASVTLGAHAQAKAPENAAYLQMHAKPAWAALQLLWKTVPAVHTKALWEKAAMGVPAETLLKVSGSSAAKTALTAARAAAAAAAASTTTASTGSDDVSSGGSSGAKRARTALQANSNGATAAGSSSSSNGSNGGSSSGGCSSNGDSSSCSTVTFVTGNAGKLEEVKRILGTSLPFAVTSAKVDLPELQVTALYSTHYYETTINNK